MNEQRNQATKVQADRLPPHSPEAEQGVLGCILISPRECLDWLLARWKQDERMFYDLRNQTIYDACVALYGELQKVDLILLSNRLKELDRLEQVGGLQYLMGLPNVVPSAANLESYAEIVREKWQCRRLIQLCQGAVERIYDYDGSVAQLLDQVEQDVQVLNDATRVIDFKSLRSVMPKVVDQLEAYHRGSAQVMGFTTGWSYMDKVLGGIVPEYGYVVMAGRPGDGKTSAALNLVEHVAMHYEWWDEHPTEKHEDGTAKKVQHKGVPVGVFSLEMSDKALGKRLLFSKARVSAGTWRTGFASKQDEAALIQATSQLMKPEIYLCDEPGLSIQQIGSMARRMVSQYGVKFFVLDYLQLVNSGGRYSPEARVAELTWISSELMKLRKRLGCPWLVLCQMNRNIEQAEAKRAPVLSDLKDCGAIEQDADQVIFIYTPSHREREEDDELIDQVFPDKEDWSNKPARKNFFVAKNRDGATGPVQMLFNKNQTRFEDWREWKLRHGKAVRADGEKMPSNEEMGV